MVLDSVATMQTNITQKYAITNENTYTKSHIAIDVDSRLILYSQAVRGPKHDTTFAIASIRSLKKHKTEYVIADKAYDTEKIRECINKEIKASDQIPLKSNFRQGWYGRLSQKTFNKEIYSLRNNVESVFSVIKRKLNGTTKVKVQDYKTKKQDSKQQFTIFSNQSK